jgi:hypothetical protein
MSAWRPSRSGSAPVERVDGRRLLTYGAVGAAGLVVLTVAVFAYQSLATESRPVPVASPAAASGGCAPAPCADVQGYTLWVSNVNVQSNLVTMQITFKNSSDSTHAAPEDLELMDSRRNLSRPIFDAPGCTPWSRHEFSNGATFGPLTMCFQVATSEPPLVLHWSPDFGLCCMTDIKLS